MDISSPRSRPKTRASKKAKGICSVCGTTRHLHDIDGLVHSHGSRIKPCTGSHKPPANDDRHIATTDSTSHTQPVDTQALGGSSNTQIPINLKNTAHSYSCVNMQHPSLNVGLIRHIPKGARPSTCKLLTNIINLVISDPMSLSNWQSLLTFGSIILEQPVRGGRRHNLTSTVKKRVVEFPGSWPARAAELFAGDTQTPPKRTGRVPNNERSVAAAVAAKLEDGNIRAASRILCSSEIPARLNEETLAELSSKHPAPPTDRPPIPPLPSEDPFQTTESDVRNLIRTFPAGSSGGPDGLRPQHILELVGCPDAGPELVTAITALVNLLLAGTCPPEMRSVLFGGTLFALRKKSGGLRPIVIGYYWRRLSSKCANAFAIPRVTTYLAPKQIGVGIPGGCEAAVHAARRFLDNMDQRSILVKLDLANAFNSLYRDCMLSSVNEILPELAPFCQLAYAEASILKFGNFTVLSQVGPQQGDPLGPLLFCLPLQPVLLKLTSPLSFGYLDDLTLGGEAATVAADVEIIEQCCSAMGLNLNRAKCEVIARERFDNEYTSLRHFTCTTPASAILLGAPLSTADALQATLDSRISELDRTMKRLTLIGRQDALLILRSSLGSPKLLHTLRCSPCASHPSLVVYDSLIHKGLELILNVAITESQWAQAALPIKMGGLGIRRVSSLALPAFLASAAGTLPLQSSILAGTHIPTDVQYEVMLSQWQAQTGLTDLDNFPTHSQAQWDKPLLKAMAMELSNAPLDAYDQARLKAVSAPHAGDWLYALPITSCGLRLDDEATRVAVGLRLGMALCEPHTCACGTLVTTRGSHGLSCTLGFGRIARHSVLNDLICRSLSKAGFPSIKEPPGLLRSDGKRPDGLTLIPWQAGRSLIWDATVIDTLAASYLPATAATAGAAAEIAAERKNMKYNALLDSYTFIPLAFETLGPINNSGISFISDLGRNLTRITGDTREASFLFQRLSITVQRFNAVAFRGTFVMPDTEEET